MAANDRLALKPADKPVGAPNLDGGMNGQVLAGVAQRFGIVVKEPVYRPGDRVAVRQNIDSVEVVHVMESVQQSGAPIGCFAAGGGNPGR